jgi:SAM-dependent methyltransferase
VCARFDRFRYGNRRAALTARIDIAEFATEYRRAVDDVLRFVPPDRQALIARHDLSLHPDRYDMRAYLSLSEKRYVPAVQMINRYHPASTPLSVLDAGGFLASFPLTLARMGIKTALSEKYGYYYGAFDDLRDYLVENGVRIWDVDMTEPAPELPDEQFSVVTNMAMIEHLADTPRFLLDNLRGLVSDDGHLLIEVPNIAYWPKRLALLRGWTVHGDIDFVYRANVPFMGHHREYTRDELVRVLTWAGYDVDEIVTHNYSWDYRADPLRNLWYRVVYKWPIDRFESCRETILACARKSETVSN